MDKNEDLNLLVDSFATLGTELGAGDDEIEHGAFVDADGLLFLEDFGIWVLGLFFIFSVFFDSGPTFFTGPFFVVGLVFLDSGSTFFTGSFFEVGLVFITAL